MPGPSTACGNASGSGNIDELVAIAAGDSIVFELMATVRASVLTGTLSNTATITPPADRDDTNPANNSATDTNLLSSIFQEGLSPRCRHLALANARHGFLAANSSRNFQLTQAIARCWLPEPRTLRAMLSL